jgi:transposase-like protein
MTQDKHPSSKPYPPEVKERAVRLVLDAIEATRGRFGHVSRIARQLDIGPETLCKWVRQAEIDDGWRPRLTTEERERLKPSSGRTGNSGGPTRSLNPRRRVQGVDATMGCELSAGVRYSRVLRGVVFQLGGDGVESGLAVGLAVDGQVGPLREVLAQETVRDLVRAALPWALRVAEVHGHVRGHAEALVVGELHAPTPGQASPQLGGQALQVRG